MTARGWLLFAAVSVVWGIPYFFIKMAVEAGVPPGFVAWSRVAMAALLLLPLAWRRGALRGLAGRWRAVAAYTACEVAVPFVLIAAGEQYIASSLAAILIASMPLMVALLSARLVAADRPTGLRLAGLLAILAGSWLATGGRNDPRRRSGAPDAGGRGVEGRRAEKGRAGHRASSAWTRTRHLRRAGAWLASEARWARRSCWCRTRWASARSSATRSATSCSFM